MAHPRNYRNSHRGQATAQTYDQAFREPSTATGALWYLEQPVLTELLETRQDCIRRVLDFACGTGRILSFLENRFDDCTGIDVSREMLDIARRNCTRATLVEGDVTRSSVLVEGPFDLVTAFRFFLQAEESLRAEALRWIHSNLAPGGYLVANFHMNPFSLRGMLRQAQAFLRGRNHRRISIPQAKKLLQDHGFVVEELRGYSHMFYPSIPRGSVSRRLRIDSLLSRKKILPALGSSFILVARPQS